MMARRLKRKIENQNRKITTPSTAKKLTPFVRNLQLIQYVTRKLNYTNNMDLTYNLWMCLALLSLHIPAKKSIFSIDEGPFLRNCRAGCSYTPLAILQLRVGTLSRDKWPDDLGSCIDWCYLTLPGMSLIP